MTILNVSFWRRCEWTEETSEAIGVRRTAGIVVLRLPRLIVMLLTITGWPSVSVPAADPVAFWSFAPLTSHLPEVADTTWPSGPVDRFVLHKMEEASLRPAGRASRDVLLRRACFDLVGLPPTIQERQHFLADQRPGAWSRLIERLLANPHLGERWGRHWLDVVRFAESYGFEHDLDNLNAYHYRDFVVRAFNDDQPYDEFVRWQLAGDELASDRPLARMATGFLAAGVRNADIAKVRVEQERYDELDDLVNTVGTSMLGLSIGCARCHDHKFDPISQEEYYQLVAVFERTVRGELELSTASTSGVGVRKVLVAGEGLKPLARIYNPGPAFYDKTWFLRRGDVKLKDHEVQPGFLDVLLGDGVTPEHFLSEPGPGVGGGKNAQTHRRTGLARWMTDANRGAGALLARVIVNRIWQHHMGRGLVITPSDFGGQGAPPSHPQLLDWLASELIRNRWRLKSVHRAIMTSQTYQQRVLETVATEADKGLFRGRRLRRLEAEAIRDSVVSLGDRFDQRLFGPGSLDTQHVRRAVYFRVKRSQPDPLLSLFDLPDTLQGTAVRSSTIVSPQALALLNAEVVRSAAAAMARRVLTEVPHGGPEERVKHLWKSALGREASREEWLAGVVFLSRQEQEYRDVMESDPDGGLESSTLALIDLCQSVFCLNEFLYIE